MKNSPTLEESRFLGARYKVLTKGGGIIYNGESLSAADDAFEVFKSQERQSDELVTLFRDSDIVKQWYCYFEP